MFQSSKSFKLICRTIVTGVLVSFLWLQSLTDSAMAVPNLNTDSTYLAQARTDVDTIKPMPESKMRSEAIKECLPPELAAIDIGERVERVLGEMGNSQIERAFDLSDNPELSDAEKSFESCLKTKGVIPARQAA